MSPPLKLRLQLQTGEGQEEDHLQKLKPHYEQELSQLLSQYLSGYSSPRPSYSHFVDGKTEALTSQDFPLGRHCLHGKLVPLTFHRQPGILTSFPVTILQVASMPSAPQGPARHLHSPVSRPFLTLILNTKPLSSECSVSSWRWSCCSTLRTFCSISNGNDKAQREEGLCLRSQSWLIRKQVQLSDEGKQVCC